MSEVEDTERGLRTSVVPKALLEEVMEGIVRIRERQEAQDDVYKVLMSDDGPPWFKRLYDLALANEQRLNDLEVWKKSHLHVCNYRHGNGDTIPTEFAPEEEVG